MASILGLAGFLLLIVIGLVQLVLGFLGLEYLVGFWAAAVGLGLVFFLRIMLPMTVGSYFGAVDVLGWPWWAGVLIVTPGFLFVVPGFVLGLYEDVKRGQRRD
jgi:hypothetical protein